MSLLLKPRVEQARAEAEAEEDEDLIRADRAKVAEPEDAAQAKEAEAREAESGVKVLDKGDVEWAGEAHELLGNE
ncbi:MAG: hypothetical protein R6U22_01310 [Desulfohalobiaceae bacterium]